VRTIVRFARKDRDTMAAFNLADLFEIVVDTVPERTALVCGDVRLRYRDLDERASRFGHHLIDRGVQPGEMVGILSWNRNEWLEAMLGCYKARAVPVNLNYRYTAPELHYVLDNAGCIALVYERSFTALLEAILPDLPAVRELVVLEDGAGTEAGIGDAEGPLVPVAYEAALADASPQRDFPPRSPDDLYILYTGGTTGMPKGVMWRSEDIFFGAMGGGGFGMDPIATPEELAGRINPDDTAALRSLVLAPLMHGGAQWATYIGLFGGATIVLNPERSFDPEHVLDLAEREQVAMIMVIGDAHARPLAEAVAAHPGRWDLSSLVVIGSGGALLTRAVKDQLRAVFPTAMILDSFGASETGANGSVVDTDEPASGPRFAMGPHTTVLDPDTLEPLSPGDGRIGKLARKGHIPLGYWRDDAKTAETFPVAPDGTRWSVPGDFAMVEADGTITLLGRGSVCINSGGEKIYPEEVEAAVKSHPDVFDAVVVGVPDERFGERVAAVVTAREGTDPTLESIQEHCEQQIARYKLPRELRIVAEIPRTAVGKPDYRSAKALFT
jgi:acyl-CoA synthetase (AMP-forming)/AMP-acid ligase II